MNNLLIDTGFNGLKKFKFGYCLYNKNDIYVGKSIELYGEYCKGETDLFAQICKRDDVVIEVGANIGTHTVALAQMVGEKGLVYAFEPQRVVFQTLCANLALNSLANTYAYSYAIGNKNGKICIPKLDYNRKNNFGGIGLENVQSDETVEIKTLDSFLEIKRLKLLKIDVVGMELDVLKGAKSTIITHHPIIYVENGRLEKSQELIEYLWSMEYELYWHTPALFNLNNYYKNKENVIGNFIAINMLCIPKKSSIQVLDLEKITHSLAHPKR
ncbi:MAG: FkbM family methyltransferase [Candidatus Marinarcus sp.]|uniref:FkbM family methyltransferase n=1 Tax=Candidatus Marinarcus sp. TaxID=3100987 RepID=UPI003B00F008